ncbi:MAG: hypothetical protein NTX86_04825 [Candidatus Dependentiae bacterium]|nr:hypothetical protein [Candidatus Dependentiae bacterium]
MNSLFNKFFICLILSFGFNSHVSAMNSNNPWDGRLRPRQPHQLPKISEIDWQFMKAHQQARRNLNLLAAEQRKQPFTGDISPDVSPAGTRPSTPIREMLNIPRNNYSPVGGYTTPIRK